MIQCGHRSHRVARTRHYLAREKKGPADRTLVFDTFVAVHRSDPLFVGWTDAHLGPDDRAALGQLARNLAALGRAEAWVLADLAEDPPAWNCSPADAGDTVPVLCPDPATALADDHYPRPDPKAVRKGLRPDDRLFDCPRWRLCLDTQTVHAHRWPRVPGARTVPYSRLSDASCATAPGAHATGLASPSSIPHPSSRIPGPRPTVAQFLLDGPVLPLLTRTVPVAEAFRRRLLGQFGRIVRRRLGLPADATPGHPPGAGVAVPIGQGGRPAGSRVARPRLLPADRRGRGRPDRPPDRLGGGFGPDEVAALAAMRELEVGPLKGLRLVLIGLGRPGDFRHRLFAESRTWVSATPFVVTRHLKRRGRRRDPAEWFGPAGRGAFVGAVAVEEWARRSAAGGGGRALVRAEYIDPDRVRAELGWRYRPVEFRRARSKPGDDGMARPHGALRLTFDGPVAGPVCLGYGSHFGLGLFVAAD